MSSSKSLSWLYHSSSLSSLGCLSAFYVLANFHLKISYFILIHIIGVHAKLLQWCLTLCNSMDHSPPGSSVHGILQARILEWVAIPFSRGSSWLRDWIRVSVSSIGMWTLYYWHHLESLIIGIIVNFAYCIRNLRPVFFIFTLLALRVVPSTY